MSSDPSASRAVPIRVGTAGWSYEDWNGIVYPEKPGRGFDQLGMMASLFDTNEINSTFYRIPDPRMTEGWARRVAHNPRFAFTAKLFRGFTHERKAGAAEEKDYARAIEPLASAGRLDACSRSFRFRFATPRRTGTGSTPSSRSSRDFRWPSSSATSRGTIRRSSIF